MIFTGHQILLELLSERTRWAENVSLCIQGLVAKTEGRAQLGDLGVGGE